MFNALCAGKYRSVIGNENRRPFVRLLRSPKESRGVFGDRRGYRSPTNGIKGVGEVEGGDLANFSGVLARNYVFEEEYSGFGAARATNS